MKLSDCTKNVAVSAHRSTGKYVTYCDAKRAKSSFFQKTFVGLGLSVALAGTVAPVHAQYIGDGQAILVTARVLGETVDAEVSSTKTVLPFAGGAPAPVGLTVFAESLTLVEGAFNADTDLVVRAEALTAQTAGANSIVNSSSGVANVPNEPGTGLNIGISSLGGLVTNTLITATEVRTETFADPNGRRSRTIFTDLTITDLTGLALTGTDGRLYSNLDITFEDSDPTVGVTVAAAGTDVVSILLHEKVNNLDTSRTTNAIRVSLLSGGALGNFANAGVTVARSTAGFAVTAAPEPGVGALVAFSAAAFYFARRKKRRNA